MNSSTCSGAPTGFSMVPVSPPMVPVASGPLILTMPDGKTIIGNLVPILCTPAQACHEPIPIQDAHKTVDWGNSPCSSPCNSAGGMYHERCISAEPPPMLHDHMEPSPFCMHTPFSLSEFPSVFGASMQCAMDQSMAYPAPQSVAKKPCADASCLEPERMQEITPMKTPNVIFQGTPEKMCKAQMFDLAEHVSAPSFPCAASDVVAQLGDPKRIIYDASAAGEVAQMLEEGTCRDTEAIIWWLQPVLLDLSLAKWGTRVVQAAIDHAETERLMAFIEGFHGHVLQLLESHHGNHVLQKMIEVVSGASENMKFILEELARYPGGWSAVVKHVFGCRVVQRIIEHCPEDATACIVDAVEAEAGICVKHPYANYVMQSVIEHGTPNQKFRMVSAVIHLGIINLAQSHIASNVVEKAFDHGDEKCKQAMCAAILKHPGAIVGMACNRWGSCTVKRIVDARQALGESLYTNVMQQLLAGVHVLRPSKHGKKFARTATSLIQASPPKMSESLPSAGRFNKQSSSGAAVGGA